MEYLTTIIEKDKDNAVAIYTSDAMTKTLNAIKEEVDSFVPDLSTPTSRKEIASLAYKVAQSKTVLDNAGKTLTADWAAKKKLVDASRAEARKFLEDLKEKVRRPLTEWEDEQKRKTELAQLAAELEEAHKEAVIENVLFDRESALAEKERIAAKKEAEKLRIMEEERVAIEQLERERLLKEQAAGEARLQAQAQIEEAKAREEKLKRDAIEAEVKAKLEKEQAERDRLQAIKDAKEAQEQAVRDAQEQAKREALQVEQQRLEAEREAARQAEVKANNNAHKAKINKEALNSFMSQGFDAKQSKKLVVMIYNKKIKNVTINY